MTIWFVGGPFHGMKLGVIEIQKFLVIVSLQGRQGVRRYSRLPRFEDWPEVLAGRMTVDESAGVHRYELVSTPQGLQFHCDEDGRDYRRAVAEDLAATAGPETDPAFGPSVRVAMTVNPPVAC